MKFKAIDSAIATTPLCLGNISKDFTVHNIKKKKKQDYMNMFMILVLSVRPLQLMIY